MLRYREVAQTRSELKTIAKDRETEAMANVQDDNSMLDALDVHFLGDLLIGLQSAIQHQESKISEVDHVTRIVPVLFFSLDCKSPLCL